MLLSERKQTRQRGRGLNSPADDSYPDKLNPAQQISVDCVKCDSSVMEVFSFLWHQFKHRAYFLIVYFFLESDRVL